jgi:hypothetical protein
VGFAAGLLGAVATTLGAGPRRAARDPQLMGSRHHILINHTAYSLGIRDVKW